MDFIENFISDELIYAIGWTMVHSLWQGFIVAILLGFAMIGLQKRSSQVRYEVACFSLFLVFILSFSTFIYLYDSVATGAVMNEITVLGGNVLTLEGTETVQTFFQSSVDYFNTHLPMIVMIWLLGVGFFLLRLMGGLAYVQKLKHQQQKEISNEWQQTFERLVKKLPIKKTIRVMESGLAQVPMVIGHIKPIILMPIGIINQLSPEDVEAVLAHELAHIYRNDYLLNLIQSLIEVLFYYHPAVWWISANIRSERENCCDDIAVRLCGNSLNYAKALVSLEEMKPKASLAMAFSGKRNQLLNRVKRILNQPQNKSNIMEKFTATCLLLAVVLVLSVSANNGITDQNELADENAQNKEILETIPEVDAQPEQEIVIEEVPLRTEADTLPKRFQGNGNFAYAKDGETVEMKYEDGEIIKLKINGEKIPREEFAAYEGYVNELLENTPLPPAPPTNPVFPATPMPPSPNSWSSSDEDGMDVFMNGRKSIVSTDEDGNKVIIIENEDGSDSKVILNNGTIKLDGEVFSFDNFSNGTLPDFETLSIFGDAQILSDNFDFVMPPMPEFPIAEIAPMVEFPVIEMPPMPEFPAIDMKGFDAPKGFYFNSDTIPPGGNFDTWNNYHDKNLTEEERAELREAMREARKGYEEAMQEYREIQKEAMENYREELAEVREKQKEAMAEMREQLAEVRERSKEQREKALAEAREQIAEVREHRNTEMEEAREHAHEARERSRELRERARAEAREHRAEARSNNNAWKKAFEQQMIQDGFLKEGGDYKFKMDQNDLKINGKKQSDVMRKKYIKLYEQTKGKELGNRFSIKITKNDSNSNTSVSIDH